MNKLFFSKSILDIFFCFENQSVCSYCEGNLISVKIGDIYPGGAECDLCDKYVGGDDYIWHCKAEGHEWDICASCF